MYMYNESFFRRNTEAKVVQLKTHVLRYRRESKNMYRPGNIIIHKPTFFAEKKWENPRERIERSKNGTTAEKLEEKSRGFSIFFDRCSFAKVEIDCVAIGRKRGEFHLLLLVRLSHILLVVFFLSLSLVLAIICPWATEMRNWIGQHIYEHQQHQRLHTRGNPSFSRV